MKILNRHGHPHVPVFLWVLRQTAPLMPKFSSAVGPHRTVKISSQKSRPIVKQRETALPNSTLV